MSHAHTLFCPPFFPPRHLVTSIYSMAHGAVTETFPVASRYRYIPNTLGRKRLLFFFCCIAELAIKPCRSSRSKLRGEFGIPNTCKTGNKNTTKQQTPPNPKHNTKQKTGKCLECETRGEKRVKRPKRPNALICRTPGGSIRYPLSSSLGMMLISHSIVSIPASPPRFAI